MPLTVTLPASEANSGDAEAIRSLLAKHPHLTRLDCNHRFRGGFSPSRVYLCQAEIAGTPANLPWILKLGPLDDVSPERDALTSAHGFVSNDNIAAQVYYADNASEAVLLSEFAVSNGRAPLDLESTLKRVEAIDAFNSVVGSVEQWIKSPNWRTLNVTRTLKEWTAGKLSRVEPSIAETFDTPVIYSADFGEAYANPGYYLSRDLKRVEVKAPFAFTHGDLNLRNVLFGRDGAGAVIANRPVFIDFRHAGVNQPAIVDLAKLEACIRYQCMPRIDSSGMLEQAKLFCIATRNNLKLATLPEACTDKTLQDNWRCLQRIRRTASQLLVNHEEAEVVYWMTLIAYAVSSTTYEQLDASVRRIAYLDAAALFTRLFQERLPGAQRQVSIHSTLGSTVLDRDAIGASASQRSLLARSVSNRQAILVIGPAYAPTGGVEPFLQFNQRTFKSLTKADPPAVASATLLDVLQRKQPRHEIQRAIRERTQTWSDHSDKAFAKLPWASVVQYHFHTMPYEALVAQGTSPVRIDTVDDAVHHGDDIAGGRQAYVSVHGDTQSKADNLVLSSADRRTKEQILNLLGRSLAQRQQPYTLLFWRCDDLAVEEIAGLRDAIVSDMLVTVDSYVLTQQDNDVRDAALESLEIWRVRLSLDGLSAAVGAAPAQPGMAEASKWQKSGETILLPNLARHSRGLLRFFPGSIVPGAEGREDGSFLVGASRQY